MFSAVAHSAGLRRSLPLSCRLFSDAFGDLGSWQPRRVVITGLGLVTPLGVGVEKNWQRLLNGDTGVRGLLPEDLPEGHAEFINQLPSKVVACVNQEELQRCEWAPKQETRRTAKFMKYAAVAAEEALKNSKWKPESDEERCYTGVAIGCGLSFTEDLSNAGILLASGSLRKLSPFFVPKVLGNMAAGDISVRYGLKGPNLSSCTACAASAHAIGDAFCNIQMGKAKVMVAGGTESCIDAIALMGFGRQKALSTNFNDTPALASRPFDIKRDGFVLGEGAGVLILEELEHARARGADMLAEIRGYGVSGDGHHITQPAPSGQGAALAMSRTFTRSGVEPKDIIYVNAHATSTPLGDTVEQIAISSVLGNDPNRNLLVSSLKGAFGHLLGAAGAVEMAATVLSIVHRAVPPTVNLANLDPKILPHIVMNEACNLPQTPLAALTNSYGFGGTNASLLLTSAPLA